MEKINRAIFLYINGLVGNPFWNTLNCVIATISPYIYALFLFIFYIRGNRDKSLYAFYSAIFALIINYLIGLFYFHPRPFMIGLGQTLLKHSPDSSFPSDHATLAFSIALSLLMDREWKMGTILFIFAILTGFARIYIGIHFPLDILGSLVVALSATIFIKFIKKSLSDLNRCLNSLYDNIMERLLKRN